MGIPCLYNVHNASSLFHGWQYLPLRLRTRCNLGTLLLQYTFYKGYIRTCSAEFQHLHSKRRKLIEAQNLAESIHKIGLGLNCSTEAMLPGWWPWCPFKQSAPQRPCCPGGGLGALLNSFLRILEFSNPMISLVSLSIQFTKFTCSVIIFCKKKTQPIGLCWKTCVTELSNLE